ncbi:MAG TPA: ectonucleotide pyrophosphatase/phosphodiesterase [Vicinamibacteria bacterium]
MLPVTVLAASLVLLSIDGLKPDYVLKADTHGLKVPNLRLLVEGGAHAEAVTGVFPTVTYPSHATMLTGVAPARHGIYSNHPFDPLSKNQDGWYWYVEDLKAMTLWEAAESAGLRTASVDWPVSVGAAISFNVAQYWRAGNAEDVKLIRALSTKGLLEEAEAALGPYPDGNDYSIAADRRRTEFIEYLLDRKKPAFLTAYFSGLDTVEHQSGPYSRETFEALEVLDGLVGRLRAKARVLCLVSDHGFLPSEKVLNLNAALHDAGLIEAEASGVTKGWKAFAWDQGGSALVILASPEDENLREQVRGVLRRLPGIDRIVEKEEAGALGGYPEAAFLVGLAKGYRGGGGVAGPVVRPGDAAGTHGYLPDVAEMDSSFFLAGEGIPRGLALGRIDMRDIAPTLAAILGVAVEGTEGRDLLEAHVKDDSEVHRR